MYVVSNSCKAAKLATRTGWLEKPLSYSYQYDGEFNGDESHCRICKESPTKQIKEHRAGWLEVRLVWWVSLTSPLLKGGCKMIGFHPPCLDVLFIQGIYRKNPGKKSWPPPRMMRIMCFMLSSWMAKNPPNYRDWGLPHLTSNLSSRQQRPGSGRRLGFAQSHGNVLFIFMKATLGTLKNPLLDPVDRWSDAD